MKDIKAGQEGGQIHVNPQRTCNTCGMKNLMWTKTEVGWRLTKDGVVHRCHER